MIDAATRRAASNSACEVILTSVRGNDSIPSASLRQLALPLPLPPSFSLFLPRLLISFLGLHGFACMSLIPFCLVVTRLRRPTFAWFSLQNIRHRRLPLLLKMHLRGRVGRARGRGFALPLCFCFSIMLSFCAEVLIGVLHFRKKPSVELCLARRTLIRMKAKRESAVCDSEIRHCPADGC